MDNDRKLTLIYFVLGVIAAAISLYVDSLIALSAAVIIYLVSLLPVRKLIEVKKTSVFLTTTLVTFILVWLVVWILLNALR